MHIGNYDQLYLKQLKKLNQKIKYTKPIVERVVSNETALFTI